MIPNEFWIVMTQYDVNPNAFSGTGPPRGPLVHEGYCLTEAQAEERAKALAGRYGWSCIMRVVSEGGRQS
jgi:hypothetical protein